MTDVVQFPTPPVCGASLWPLSVAAYRALGEAGLIPKNTELLYGQVYKKMSKSPYHSYLLQLLQETFNSNLSAGRLLRTEQPIACGDSELEPDLAVIIGRNQDFRREHPQTAELVVEVCISSHDYDRSKLRAYALAGVKECWFVLGPEKKIEVYRQPQNGQYTERTLHGPGGTLTSTVLPELTVGLDVLFAS